MAWLRIERPERMNALDRPTYRALCEQVETAAASDARVLVLSGAGRAFCAGADLKARGEDSSAGDVERTLRAWAHPLLRALRAAPQPVLAAVNGPAVGIGCALALACDLVIAAASATLSLPFARIGLGPDGGVTALATARAGSGPVAQMLLTGATVGAEQARAWGLVDRVVDDASLEREVETLAQQVAAGAPAALAAAKRALGRSTAGAFERELELEAPVQGALARTRDHAEALAAFAERRTPRFTGA